MKKQYTYIARWFAAAVMLEGCCLGGYEYTVFDTDISVFNLPHQVTYFKDSLDNEASIWYEDFSCTTIESDRDYTSDNCDRNKGDLCTQATQVYGTNDLRHYLTSIGDHGYYHFRDLTIRITDGVPYSSIELDSIVIRGATYFNPYYYEVEEADGSDIQLIVFSYTTSLIKVKLTNGTVWERLP